MDKNSDQSKNLIEAYKKGMRVDENGVLFGLRGKPRRLSLLNGQNYYYCGITTSKGVRPLLVHQLQAYQKFGDDIFGDTAQEIHIRHLNGNSKDNSVGNIGIGSASDNFMDIPKEKRIKNAKYAASFIKKFSDDDIHDIRNMRKDGFTYKKIGLKYNSSKGHICDIINKKIYKDID